MLLETVPNTSTLAPRNEEVMFGPFIKYFKTLGIDFDAHKVVGKWSIDDLDEAMRAFIKALAKDKRYPDPEPYPNYTYKWRMMSAVQQAIRRSQPERAVRFASRMIASGDGPTLLRRLAVISMEDIGLASPMTGAIVCHMAQHSYQYKTHEILTVVELMSKGAKSRELCDTTVYLMLPHTLKGQLDDLNDREPEYYVQVASDFQEPTARRIIALRALRGKKYAIKGKVSYLKAPNIQYFLEALENLKLPDLIKYAILQANKAEGEGLFLSVAHLWPWWASTDLRFSEKTAWPALNFPPIGGVTTEAFDQHTREGKSAIRYILKSEKTLISHLNSVGITDTDEQVSTISRAMFYVEGSLLTPHIKHENSDALYDNILEEKMISNGFAGLPEGLAFYDLFHDSLHGLHKARTRILKED